MWPIDWDRSRLDLGAAVEILSLFLVLVSKECHIILIQHMAYTWHSNKKHRNSNMEN